MPNKNKGNVCGGRGYYRVLGVNDSICVVCSVVCVIHLGPPSEGRGPVAQPAVSYELFRWY